MSEIASWPSHLPGVLWSPTMQPVNPQMETPMEDGRIFVRRNATATPVDFEVRWIFTSEQAADFEAFYKDTLTDGTKPFMLPLVLPQGSGPWRVNFRGIYSYKLIAAGGGKRHWEYTARLQMYLRPQRPPQPST